MPQMKIWSRIWFMMLISRPHTLNRLPPQTHTHTHPTHTPPPPPHPPPPPPPPSPPPEILSHVTATLQVGWPCYLPTALMWLMHGNQPIPGRRVNQFYLFLVYNNPLSFHKHADKHDQQLHETNADSSSSNARVPTEPMLKHSVQSTRLALPLYECWEKRLTQFNYNFYWQGSHYRPMSHFWVAKTRQNTHINNVKISSHGNK